MGIVFFRPARAFAMLSGTFVLASSLSCNNAAPEELGWIAAQRPRTTMQLSIADGAIEEHPRALPSRAPGFQGCILSLPQPYFSQEQGIKARICPKDSVLEWQREWTHLHSAGAENDKIHTVTARAFAKAWSAPILFFYDGNSGEDFLPFQQKAQFSAIASRYIVDDYRDRALKANAVLTPVSFPYFAPSILISKKKATLIFACPRSRKIHYLEFSLPPARIRALLRKFQRRFKGIQESDKIADEFDIQSGSLELYNRKQLELRCSTRTHFAFRTDNRSFQRTVPCWSNSVVLLRRKPSRIIDWIAREDSVIEVPSVGEGVDIQWTGCKAKNPEADQTADLCPGTRSWIPQRLPPPGHTLGIGPPFKSYKHPDLCSLEDIDLTEFNPTGITDATGGLEIGGKFIELRFRNKCDTRSISIEIEGRRLLLESAVTRGDRYVLVADRSFFATNRSDAVFQENHLLRVLSLDSDVRISDGRNSRSLRPSFESLPLLYSRQPVQAAFQTYSLVSASYPLLHPSRCAGLLPDLCKLNAMSPGAPEGTLEVPEISMDEILARGTESSADEEFVEFKAATAKWHKASGAAIVFKAEGQRTYKFALPMPLQAGRRLAYMRRLHESFAPGNIYTNNAFRIPNHPFTLQVQLVFRDESGIHNETILDRQFIEKEILPRSHSLVASPWGLRPSWSEDSFPASPGRSGFFVPSLIVSGSDSLSATWQSSEPADFRTDTPEPGLRLSLVGGQQQLSAACPRNYCVISLNGPIWKRSLPGESDEQQHPSASGPNRSGRVAASEWEFAIWNTASRCQFQEVSPHNPDWLRICFPDGIQNLAELRLSDENDTDRLVPLTERRSNLPEELSHTFSPAQSGCALIVDPQMDGASIQSLLQPGDTTVLTSADYALGNGIREEESLALSNLDGEICTYRKRKNPDPYPIPGLDELVSRKPGSIQDRPGAYDLR